MSRDVYLSESMNPRALWRARDSEDAEWTYSDVPINPEKWRYVEVFKSEYQWVDGFRDDPRYELTDLGKAYRDAMQRGAKLNGGVKAGEGGE